MAYRSRQSSRDYSKRLRKVDLSDNNNLRPEIDANSKQLFKDLASSVGIKAGSGFDGKTSHALIAYMSPQAVMHENSGKINSGGTHFEDSGVGLRDFFIRKNSNESVTALHIATKIGLSALLWGNPIVGVVGSAMLSLAFSQIGNGDSSDADKVKRENEIFSDIFKYSSLGSKQGGASSLEAGLSSEDMDEIEMSIKGFKDPDIAAAFETADIKELLSQKVNLSIISQRSLTMLKARLGNVDEKERIASLRHAPYISWALPIDSLLAKSRDFEMLNCGARFEFAAR